MKIAYFFSTFPHLGMTFLQREIRGLNSLGIFPLLAANRPPAAGDFHPHDQDLRETTFYLNPIRPWHYLSANLMWLVRRPGRYFSAVVLALKLHDRIPGQRLRNLARLAGAAVLARHLHIHQVRHVHVHFAFGAAGVAILLEALSGIPYSISVHGSDILLPQPLTREKLRRARFIISNCHHHIAFLHRRFPILRRQRFFTVPLGLNLATDPWRWVQPMAAVAPALRILHVARFDPVKGHDLLISACRQLQNLGVPFHCRLVGAGPLWQAVHEQIRTAGLAAQMELLGPLFEEEVARQFDWCHVFVLSSRSEGTPMTVIEAMAKGRAVVAPDISGLPEMVVQGQTGLLYPPASSAALADCLARLYHEPLLLAKMGIAGRSRAEKQFNARANTNALKAIFTDEVG